MAIAVHSTWLLSITAGTKQVIRTRTSVRPFEHVASWPPFKGNGPRVNCRRNVGLGISGGKYSWPISFLQWPPERRLKSIFQGGGVGKNFRLWVGNLLAEEPKLRRDGNDKVEEGG